MLQLSKGEAFSIQASELESGLNAFGNHSLGLELSTYKEQSSTFSDTSSNVVDNKPSFFDLVKIIDHDHVTSETANS